MSIASQIAMAQKWLKYYWSDKLAYLKGLVQQHAVTPNDTSPPTDPTGIGSSIATNTITMTWTASTDNFGVAGYEVSRKLSAGAYSVLATSQTTSYVDATVPLSTLATYKVRAYDAAGNYSGYSGETSQTTPSGGGGGLTADVTAPPVPAQPTAGTITDTTYAVSWAPVTDTAVGGAITSGTRRYPVFEGATQVGYSYQPSAGTAAKLDIGSPVVAGSDSGTGSGTLVAGGAAGANTNDQGYFSYRPTTGDGVAVLRINSIAATDSHPWCKGALMRRAGTDQSAAFISGVVFPSGMFLAEYRDANGGQAGQSSSVTLTFPFLVRITYTGNVHTVEYSQNTGSPSYTILVTRNMAAFAETVLTGKFADHNNSDGTGSVSVVYQDFAITPASAVAWNGTGTAGTTISVTTKSEDAAGNISAASTARSITFTGGGGGGGGGSVETHQYPKFGLSLTAGQSNGDQGYSSATDRDLYAQHGKLILLGGNLDGQYPNQSGMTEAQTYADFIARSVAYSTLTKIVLYDDWNESPFNYNWRAAWLAKVDANNWWVYRSGTAGARTLSSFGAGWGLINMTHRSPTDGGLYPYEYAATLAISQRTAALAYISGFCVDNMFYYPIVGQGESYDYSRANLGLTFAQTKAEFRTGEADYPNKIISLQPTMHAGGNLGGLWGATVGDGEMTELEGVASFVTREYCMGASSFEQQWGTQQFLRSYKQVVAKMRSGQDPWMMNQVRGINPADGRIDGAGHTAYQGARYTICLNAMGPGYWIPDAYPDGYGSYSSLTKYDENWGGTLNNANFAGNPVDPQQDTPRNNGLFWRDFERARFYVNTRGAGPITITIPNGFKCMTGTGQRNDINDGSTAGASKTIADGDGLVLLRV